MSSCLVLAACGGTPAGVPGDSGKAGANKAGSIAVDGSSTVYPITEAVAEEFKKTGKGRVTIGVSGTGGGFKKFCKGETVISGASRPIKPSEVELCATNKVEYVELPVAYDGLAVVVNPKNDWVDHMTVAELKKLWEPEAQEKITKWSDIREGWPEEPIKLFGAGVDSGTYDYFTKAIVGKEHASRGDFTSSEDDNILVQGISADRLAIGFFGFAYYSENKSKLKIVPVEDGKADNGDGPIAPSLETVANGTYQPLSRPIFIYVSKGASERADVKDFVDFYLKEGAALSEEVGYIPLPPKAYELVHKRFNERTVGSLFEGKGSKVGVTIEELLGAG
ncbi:MAG: PstS family phosphate ABC transporter substrate-binding protein [Nannocystaceae bacterium]